MVKPTALSIVKHPAPVLREICAPVTEFTAELRDLADAMLYTIGPRDDQRCTGVGLAAPQVNRLIRMVVIAVAGFAEMAMVNPIIERGKGRGLESESCLSLPGTHGGVFRHTTIWVSYQDLDGKQCTLKAKDFLARVIQHEVDHLDGIEFTDRIAEQGTITNVGEFLMGSSNSQQSMEGAR